MLECILDCENMGRDECYLCTGIDLYRLSFSIWNYLPSCSDAGRPDQKEECMVVWTNHSTVCRYSLTGSTTRTMASFLLNRHRNMERPTTTSVEGGLDRIVQAKDDIFNVDLDASGNPAPRP